MLSHLLRVGTAERRKEDVPSATRIHRWNAGGPAARATSPLIPGASAGEGWVLVVAQVATALILVLAANTSFADFPRLSSFLARDGFLPRQFAFRGERLAFTTGIIALSAVAIALLIGFQASVSGLIPLYTPSV